MAAVVVPSIYQIYEAGGEQGGDESVQLLDENMPEHKHEFFVNVDTWISQTPLSRFISRGTIGEAEVFSIGTTDVQLDIAMVSQQAGGGGQFHDNMSPFITFGVIIQIQEGA
jgi:microcystin-dependent protein